MRSITQQQTHVRDIGL